MAGGVEHGGDVERHRDERSVLGHTVGLVARDGLATGDHRDHRRALLGVFGRDHEVHALPDGLIGAPPQQPLGGRAPRHDGFAGDGEDSVGRCVGEGLEGLGTPVGGELVGQVASDAHHGADRAVVGRHDDVDHLHDDDRTVAATTPEPPLPLTVVGERCPHGAGEVTVLGRHDEVPGEQPHRLLGGPAVELLGAAVPQIDAALAVGDDDRCIERSDGRVEHGGERVVEPIAPTTA